MSAHGGEHAHDSDATELRKTGGKYVNVDSSGVSMSWKTAIAVIGFFLACGAAWTVFTATLSTKAELIKHGNGDLEVHTVTITPEGEDEPIEVPVTQQVEADHKSVITVKNAVGKLHTKVDHVEDGIYEQRAEDLAYRAVEALPARTTDERKLRLYKSVKRKAKLNLKSGGDIREGLGEELDF
jgi:hypothetical protein